MRTYSQDGIETIRSLQVRKQEVNDLKLSVVLRQTCHGITFQGAGLSGVFFFSGFMDVFGSHTIMLLIVEESEQMPPGNQKTVWKAHCKCENFWIA